MKSSMGTCSSHNVSFLPTQSGTLFIHVSTLLMGRVSLRYWNLFSIYINQFMRQETFLSIAFIEKNFLKVIAH